ncbi:uncharacterized protein L199_000698 [Kwoniella botswanensis]|uniref:uncharacterized protein n=1 Tax=Kwoniella botswanensis TaxID=1268659 RepID=UPI00315D69FE
MTETIDQHPKYHPSFTDGDDLVIANDHTHFAAQCERLAGGSQVFKNMIDLPKPACSVNGDSTAHSEVRKKENVIDTGVNSNLAGYFLAFLGADIPLFPPTSFADTCKLMRPCDQFEASDENVDLIRDRLISESKGNLWKLLGFASKMDDRKLGPMALRKMNLESFPHGREPENSWGSAAFVTRMSELSPAWQGKLYSLALKDEKVTVNRLTWVARVSKKGRDYTTRDWEPTQVPGLTFVHSWERICNGFASHKQLQYYNISSLSLKYVKVGLHVHGST